jgi:hypothetical protein
MNERIFDPGLAMRLFVLIALLFPLFQCAPLPVEIVDEICSYLNSAALFKLRTVNREFKSQVERYAKRKIKLIPRFGFIRDWQLAQIKNENFGLREQLYSPINSRNHLKLLSFVANYPELRAIYWSLRADVDGFLKPMVKYYERRIHGLDDFVALFNCDHLRENRYNADYYDDWINRELWFLITGLKCLQG